MSKYDSLGVYLKRQAGDRIPMTFAEIEKIIGAKLPRSAREHRPWWGNSAANHVNAKAWLDAGFESEQVDMAGRKLVFRRVRKRKLLAAGGGEQPVHPAYGYMKGLVRVMPGTDLTRPADPEWADRLEAEYGADKRED